MRDSQLFRKITEMSWDTRRLNCSQTRKSSREMLMMAPKREKRKKRQTIRQSSSSKRRRNLMSNMPKPRSGM